MSKACRDLSKLHELFRPKVEMWLEDCAEDGIKLIVTETFRTTERQKYLYKKGLSFLDGVKEKSLHQLGMAIDIAFDPPTHGNLYPENDALWGQIADLAKLRGMDWGYDLWRWDKCHFQSMYTPLPLTIMDDKQKQLIELVIYACKCAHDFGTDEMKKVAREQAQEWRKLLQKIE